MFEIDIYTYQEIDIEIHYQEYNIKSDFEYLQKVRNIKSIVEITYQIVKEPHILEETTFYQLMGMVNIEQAKIKKEILTKKIKSRLTNILIYNRWCGN